MSLPVQAVTGAFGYSGKHIARRLLAQGLPTVTLTNSPTRPNSFAGRVKAFPLRFERPEDLARSLQGVDVLYNTYWVRFNHSSFTYAEAVRNSRILFEAAKGAGVRRVVHISITNPSLDAPFEYFRGKAMVEQALTESGLSYAILRPAVLFGHEDILINNIAWVLRRLPVFGVFGDGRYRLQPIYVGDLADLAVTQGSASENAVIDAIGPETFTYRDLAEAIADLIGRRRPIVSVPPSLGYWGAMLLGRLKGDVIITKDEVRGLMADLLYVDSPPAGRTRLTDWVRQHSDVLGTSYASELARRLDRSSVYGAAE